MKLTETEKIIIQMKMLELGLIPYLAGDKYIKFYVNLEANDPKKLNVYKRKFRKVKRSYAKKYKLDSKLITNNEVVHFIASEIFPHKNFVEAILSQNKYGLR
jgi:hypothetical protein